MAGGSRVLRATFFCPRSRFDVLRYIRTGFTKDGKNYNFYDSPDLFRAVRPFIVQSIRDHMSLGLSPGAAIVLGAGKNKAVFEDLNREFGFFKTVLALEHPRFIMQYRRSRLDEYIRKYEETFRLALNRSRTR